MISRVRICSLALAAAAAVPMLAGVGRAQQPNESTTAPATHLHTRWARDVNPAHPLPEYPRPQMTRRAWQNLNGRWQYAIRDSGAAAPTSWDGTIVVPFPLESQLGGVARPLTETQRLWYRRTFRAPRLPAGGRLLLHFGAVDWDAQVFVNGQRVGEHRGGYDPFTVDVTDALRGGGDQELVVGVWDPTNKGPQPRGKQVQHPHSIWYTAVSGIWQTVWLEPVPAAHITHLLIVPDVDAGALRVATTADGAPAGTRVRVTARDGSRTVGSAEGAVGDTLVVRIPRAKLWSPDRPFLYTLHVALSTGDAVDSYAGMRKIAVARDSAGVNRLFLNGRPLFEFGPLDQGWWPGGLYTAPTDAALRSDIATTKRLGFDMIRKHVKVEPERWYYWADRLGILVWQDMPSGDNDTPAAKTEFAEELRHVVDARRDHPSIVMWVPFNEGWGQHDTRQVVAWLKGYDPSRLVDNASGWTDMHVGDVADMHTYPGPGMPPLEPTRASVLGEFGGLGLPITGHLWVEKNNWGYRTFTSRDSLGAAYRGLIGQLRFLIGQGLAAAVYTQTTDVEIEVNGLMTYDRAIVKLPPSAIAANRTVYGPPPVVRSVVPVSGDVGQPWRYTMTKPDTGWTEAGFADSTWKLGYGGFGSPATEDAFVRTPWEGSDIWLRRTIELPTHALVRPYLRIYHDDTAEVYLNGHLVGSFPGYTKSYVEVPLDAAARRYLHPGANTLAVHAHQVSGGQYIDVGLDEVLRP